jgi:hypothetical protein
MKTAVQVEFLEALSQWERENEHHIEDVEIKCRELLCLVGQVIESVEVEEDGSSLLFRLGTGAYVHSRLCEDCCSETWFSDVFGLANIIGKPVTGVYDIPLDVEKSYNVNDGRGRQEEDEFYGFTIRVDGFQAIFAYRNSSNGYYGGGLSKCNISLLRPTFFDGQTKKWVDISDVTVWMAD